LSRETATIFGRGTILEPSTSHIGQGVALVAQTAAFVYIYVRISQIAEMTLSFHATFFPQLMAPPSGERSVCTCNCLCHSPRPASYLTCTLYQECSIDHGQPEVRLLTVRPGSLTDPLECDLSCVSLHAQPRFKALSYTWGGVDFKRTIVVNGHKVCITPNLYAALEHLRDLFSTAVLWVDAVCINQSDVRERNHQVSQMAMIYAAADEVISWLGEPADNSDLAMEFIASYTRSQRDVTRLRASATNRDSGLWLALVSLWSRPYWTRVWVSRKWLQRAT
jgi:Heterokaryon incompatibility protein (HET)